MRASLAVVDVSIEVYTYIWTWMRMQGEVVARPMMYIALTYDHRLVDGREVCVYILCL